MEDDCLEKVMWNVLQKFGLDEKKLAVFDVSESGVIAGQICDHLGVICEGLHVDIVAGWVQTISASEPYQKRLRGRPPTRSTRDWKLLASKFHVFKFQFKF